MQEGRGYFLCRTQGLGAEGAREDSTSFRPCRTCCIKDTFFFVEFFKQYLQYIYTMRKLLINCFCLINKHNHQGQGVLLGHFLCVLSRQDQFWSYVLPASKKSCASCPASSSTTLLYDCFGWSSLVPYRR